MAVADGARGGGGRAILGLIGVIIMGWLSGGAAADPSRHSCAGAGRWFPADPEHLRATIEKHLRSAEAPSPKGRVEALIVPHAGYLYCGPVAGEAFKTLQGRNDVERVVILAFSHSFPVRGISALDVEAYETPLGDIPVDREAVETLLKNPVFTTAAHAHVEEHSDENQLPFLQVVLGEGFRIVPLLVGRLEAREFDRAAEAIRPLIDDRTVLVVSSDFTHYGEAYGFAPFQGPNVKQQVHALDKRAIDKICAKDLGGFREYLRETGATICGVQPISLLLKVLPPQAEGHLLRYQTSADVSGGDYSMAVGYAAIVFDEQRATTETTTASSKSESAPSTLPESARGAVPDSVPAPTPTYAPDAPGAPSAPARTPGGANHEEVATELKGLEILTREEQQILLRLARRTLAKAFEFDPPRIDATLGYEELADFPLTEALRDRNGAFVTLTIGGNLRGCIGYIVGREPLYRAVMQNALNAAFNDPRFEPMNREEFNHVHIEISVLSSLEKTRPEDVMVGRDGLVLSGHGRSGVLLPQVPVEQGWTRTEFLDYLCRKAGLAKDAWRDVQNTTLQRFGAQVFGEE